MILSSQVHTLSAGFYIKLSFLDKSCMGRGDIRLLSEFEFSIGFCLDSEGGDSSRMESGEERRGERGMRWDGRVLSHKIVQRCDTDWGI